MLHFPFRFTQIHNLNKKRILYFIIAILIIIIILICLICQFHKSKITKFKEIGLAPKTDSVISVLMYYHSTDYFIYQGHVLGFQIDLLNEFANYIHKPLKIIVEQDFENYKQHLLKKDINIYTFDCSNNLFFSTLCDTTIAIYKTKPVLVSKSTNIIDTLNKNTSANKPQKIIHIPVYFSEKINKNILDTNYNWSFFYHIDKTTEDLLELLNQDSIEYLISSETVINANKNYYKNLQSQIIGESYPRFWIIPKGQDKLIDTVNQWLVNFKKTKKFQTIYNRYFTNIAPKMLKQKYHKIKNGKLTPYDNIIKHAAKQEGVDWRLIASIMFQETKFQTDLIGKGGTFGLMQMSPETGRLYGISSQSDEKSQIIAAIKHYKDLLNRYPNVTDSTERNCFALAAYNAGIGHISDARALALKYGKDPNSWTDVMTFLNLKHKSEYYNQDVVKCGYFRATHTLNYIQEVLARYEQYKQIYSI